jgi:hypothetical protein
MHAVPRMTVFCSSALNCLQRWLLNAFEMVISFQLEPVIISIPFAFGSTCAVFQSVGLCILIIFYSCIFHNFTKHDAVQMYGGVEM